MRERWGVRKTGVDEPGMDAEDESALRAKLDPDAPLVIDHRAALEAQQDPMLGRLKNEMMEHMLTSAPPRLRASTGANAWHMASVPK